jgi:hydantoinase/carbamoylase family amidase
LDQDKVSVLDELQHHGLLGEVESSHLAMPLKAHFELHIEQGPILDENNIPVAAVSGVQAFRWYEIKLQGRGSHAGTTPMAYRRDPLKAFAQMILAAETIADVFGGLATIGRIGSHAPQSTNCIMDDVLFHLDLRHHDDAELDKMEATIRKRFTEITSQLLGVEIAEYKALTGTSSVRFNDLAISCIQEACKDYSSEALISGAGHDS